MTDTDFRDANLDRAWFEGAKLRTTNFSNASLDGTFFHGTTVSSGDFTGVNLRRAVFSEVDFGYSVIWPVDFEEEDLKVGLKKIQRPR